MANIPVINAGHDTAIGDKVTVDSISPGDVANRLKAVTNELRPYKVYSATLTQAGGGDPVVTVLENAIGAVVWTRSGPGQYIGTLANAFPVGKSWCMVGNIDPGDSELPAGTTGMFFLTVSQVMVLSARSGAYADDVFNQPVSLEIRVYP